MSKGGEGSPNSDNDGQGGRGVKNLTFFWTSFVNGPLKTSHVTFSEVRLCARGVSGAFLF